MRHARVDVRRALRGRVRWLRCAGRRARPRAAGADRRRPIRSSAGGAPAPAPSASASRSRVVLTCAVLETDDATVVVDQTRLEPSVVQFAPFEVLGGTHGADLRTEQRRFFQYEYRLRLIADDMFGKDVALPETKISYHVQSKVGQKTSLQGRDQTYVLPAQSIRVLSLVPADATDIRDTSASDTFGDIDQRAFRANLFTVSAACCSSLAGLMALLGAGAAVPALSQAGGRQRSG